MVVFGLGNFAVNAVQTRSQLGMVASKEDATQEEGVRKLMARGVLFDALQGGAPSPVRLAAIATLARLAEGGKNDKAFRELLQMLKDPDTESAEAKTHPVRDAAKDAVAKVGTAYPDILLDAAKDADANIRDQSRAALKQIGAPLEKQMAARLGDSALRAPLGDILSSIGPETIPLIVPYLGKTELDKFADKPDDLASAKVQLIETLGKFKAPDAATPLMPFKDDADPNVRRTVVTSLANIADPVGGAVLIEALQDQNTDASARAAAAGALGGIATPEANAAMAKALSDYDRSVAVAAGAGLRRAGDLAAQAIAEALKNPDPAVRALAADASGGLRTTTLATGALTDPDAGVRAEAAESLGDILTRAGDVRANLTRLASGSTAEKQAKALQNLQTSGALYETLRPGAPAGARESVIRVLESQASAAADDKAKKPFTDVIAKLNDVSILAAEAKRPPLAETASGAAVAPLLTALNDSDGTVAGTAARALGRVGQPAVAPLVALLGGANDTVAYYASQALAYIGAPAVDGILPAAQAASPGARWAAITLGDIADPRAKPALESLAQSADPDTAYAASAALAKQ